ncbi:hypothetical protein HHK36_019342 [Tetracentron sinense]|uniref:RRM domain-containing protein n=1 Tax=Tetracentron sinense TaxID=13715 RepID=A0A834YZ28_TETSI|nr:hypothetical protein HHK36_019342 [Tetracentron sinense]
MPRAKANAAAARKPVEPEKLTEPEKPIESEERVDFDGDDDPEEMDEEVEYEEVEEEEEVEEVEEEVEEEDEVEEEEEEEVNIANGADAQRSPSGDEMEAAKSEDDDERKKQAELLALPPHGSEVYIGGIAHDASEEDLRGFCESVGEVTEVRIMKGKDSGENKGYAFVTFRTKELASKAIEELNNTELKEPHNSSRNRGFAFIEYYNHACADYSRQKMLIPKFKLDNNAPTVSWADPKTADSSPASQVKAVYVKNLPKHITQDQLRELFEHHGEITRVVLPPAKSGHEKSRFGFVHFAERSSAMKALKNTEKYEIDGQIVECSLAKPQADQKSTGGPHSQKSGLLPSYPPRAGYGLVGGAYGALGAGYGAAGFAQPLIYGRGPTPAGMAMMPMLLPDGRIGYVLQQPGAHPLTSPPQQHRSGSRSGGSSSAGRQNSDSGRGRRLSCYSFRL